MNDILALIGMVVIPVGMLGGLILYPVLQYKSLRSMRGWWRFFAFLPLIPMGFILVITFIGLVQGSNLWPLLMIFTAPVALLYFGVLYLVHYWVEKRP